MPNPGTRKTGVFDFGWFDAIENVWHVYGTGDHFCAMQIPARAVELMRSHQEAPPGERRPEVLASD